MQIFRRRRRAEQAGRVADPEPHAQDVNERPRETPCREELRGCVLLMLAQVLADQLFDELVKGFPFSGSLGPGAGEQFVPDKHRDLRISGARL